jgi:hypothetical protein
MMPGAFSASAAVVSRNRWLVLGLTATVVLVCVVALSLTGVIGGGGNAKRNAVAAYIDEVNATQRGLAIERQQVGQVYARVRRDPKGLAGNTADLDRSVRSLRRFDARLRALDPPADAVALHRRLIALSAAETAFAAEIARLGRYLPALTAERRAVAVAGAILQRELAVKTTPKQQVAAEAAAFERFASSVDTAAKPLQEAPVPTALRPARAEELARSAELATAARALATALREGKQADAQALVQRFGEAAAGSGNAVERKAVIAFDAQARRLTTLRAEVADERAKIDRELR